MQKSAAADMKVAGTTIQLHASQSASGKKQCQSTRKRLVRRVYERGRGVLKIRSQPPTWSWKWVRLWSCKKAETDFGLAQPHLFKRQLMMGPV
jgi:hypothetical protein